MSEGQSSSSSNNRNAQIICKNLRDEVIQLNDIRWDDGGKELKQDVLELLSSSAGRHIMDNSVNVVLELVDTLIHIVSAVANMAKPTLAQTVYVFFENLFISNVTEPEFAAVQTLFKDVSRRLEPLLAAPLTTVKDDVKAQVAAAKLLQAVVMVLSQVEEIVEKSQKFTFCLNRKKMSRDEPLVEWQRKLDWSVEDMEWVSHDHRSIINIAWRRETQAYIKNTNFSPHSGCGQDEASKKAATSLTDQVLTLVQMNGKEQYRLKESIKRLGPLLEHLLDSHDLNKARRSEVVDAVSYLINTCEQGHTMSQFAADVLEDLKHRMPDAITSPYDFEVSARLLLHVFRHMGLATFELHCRSLRLKITQLFGAHQQLSKTSTQIQMSLSKADYLVQLHQTPLDGQSPVSDSHFEEMWKRAVNDFIAETGENPSQSFNEIKDLADLKDLVRKGKYDFLASRASSGELREVMDPIFRFLQQGIALAGEIGAGLGFKPAKILSNAINILFESAKGVSSSYNHIENLLRELSELVDRFKVYLTVDMPIEWQGIIIEELCQVLRIFCLVTKAMQMSRKRMYFSKITNQNDEIPAAMTKLKQLLKKEERMVRATTAVTVIGIKKDNLEKTGRSEKTEIKKPTKPALPSRPPVLLGRDSERRALIDSVMKFSNCAILGNGGIGKTSLSLAVLHDEQVQRHFQSLYFVKCEGVTTIEQLYTSLAECCGIPPEQREPIRMREQVLDYFREEQVIVCFDNFETLWDNKETQTPVEQTLADFTSLDNVSVLITMRGTELPGMTDWHTPVHPVLKPLTRGVAFSLFQRYSRCSNDDKYAHRLVAEMDALPLAVEIMGYLARREGETTKELWNRYEKQGIRAISRSPHSKSRLLDLDTSIKLSLNSPRILNVPTAHSTLALLSLLPDGLSKNGEIFKMLQEGESGLSEAITALLGTSLAFIDSSLNGHRYRTHATVARYARDFLQHTLQDNMQVLVIQSYITFLKDRSPYYPNQHQIVSAELLNADRVFKFALDRNSYEGGDIVDAIINLSEWQIFRRASSGNLLDQLLENRNLAPNFRGDSLKSLGRVYLEQYRLDESERLLLEALNLHEQDRAVREGKDRSALGELYLKQFKLDKAKEYLETAVELHQQSRSIFQEGVSKRFLGEVYIQQNELHKAEQCLFQALELHQRDGAVSYQGTDKMHLAEVYYRLDRLDTAEEFLLEALKLHQESFDIDGEGSDNLLLGQLYLRRERLAEAETFLNRALNLHQQAYNTIGEGTVRLRLGEVYISQNRLQEAEESLIHATQLHLRARHVLSEGSSRTALGELYLKLHRLDEAESSLRRAAQLHKQASSIIGEGTDQLFLGQIYFQWNRFDEAEQCLQQAVKLHQQADSDYDLGIDTYWLGELYCRLDRLDEAEEWLRQALDYEKSSQCPHDDSEELLAHIQGLRQSRNSERT